MRTNTASQRQKERNILISRNELKQMIHWAHYGVEKARGGSYMVEIAETLGDFAKQCGLRSFKKPTFARLCQ